MATAPSIRDTTIARVRDSASLRRSASWVRSRSVMSIDIPPSSRSPSGELYGNLRDSQRTGRPSPTTVSSTNSSGLSSSHTR